MKALLARRLIEAGSTFGTVSGAWGCFDHHGDDVKWGVPATVYHHPGIPRTANWIDPRGRPRSIVTDGGLPIRELIE